MVAQVQLGSSSSTELATADGAMPDDESSDGPGQPEEEVFNEGVHLIDEENTSSPDSETDGGGTGISISTSSSSSMKVVQEQGNVDMGGGGTAESDVFYTDTSDWSEPRETDDSTDVGGTGQQHHTDR